MTELLYKELSYKIVGVLFNIYNELGYGYQEKYYQKATASGLKKIIINRIRKLVTLFVIS